MTALDTLVRQVRAAMSDRCPGLRVTHDGWGLLAVVDLSLIGLPDLRLTYDPAELHGIPPARIAHGLVEDVFALEWYRGSWRPRKAWPK